MYNLIYNADLFQVADVTQIRLKEKFDIRDLKVEEAFDKDIAWTPHLYGKSKYHIVCCEIAERPFSKKIPEIHSEISISGKLVKLFVAYPQENSLSAKELLEDIAKAKSYGVGLINVSSDGKATIDNEGLSVHLTLPKPVISELSRFVKPLKSQIEGAISTYINGAPKHGVQEIGQLIENIIRNLAIQARKQSKLTKGGDPSDPKYAFGNIVDDLMRQNIINNGILGNCRGFVEDRNRVSHKPRSIKQAIEVENQLKQDFINGLRILENLPKKIKEKNFRLKL